MNFANRDSTDNSSLSNSKFFKKNAKIFLPNANVIPKTMYLEITEPTFLCYVYVVKMCLPFLVLVSFNFLKMFLALLFVFFRPE